MNYRNLDNLLRWLTISLLLPGAPVRPIGRGRKKKNPPKLILVFGVKEAGKEKNDEKKYDWEIF